MNEPPKAPLSSINYCPLISKVLPRDPAAGLHPVRYWVECLLQDCAWYSEEHEACAIPVLAQVLDPDLTPPSPRKINEGSQHETRTH